MEQVGDVGRLGENRAQEVGSDLDPGILLSRIFAWSEALARAVVHWQATQHLDGSITLKLQPREPLGEEALSDIRRNFGRYMKGVDIRTQLVTEIPPGPNGKRQTVVVEHN